VEKIMKIQRTENAKRNIKFGILQRMVMILMPFATRTVLLKTLGMDYLGLNSLFSSVLQMLNLTELGFSTAVVYSMYKPIAEDDIDEICALLNLYRKVYRIVGWVILGLGLLLVPFLDMFIDGEAPQDVSIYVIYIIYLMNTVISYWLFAYKSAIPNAYQRTDVVSRAYTVSQVVQTLCQVAVLLLVRNYYLYIVFLPLATVLNNLLVSYYVKKYFPQYHCRGKVNDKTLKDIKTKVSGLLIQNVCATTRNALDSVCISAFIGLTMAAVYNNYYYIVSALSGICGIVGSSITAGVGNGIALENPNANYQVMKKIEFVYMLVSGWMSVCLLCLYQPFMEVWVGTDLQMPFGIAVCFTLYFYVLRIGDIRSVYSSGAGLWWENRFRALAESILNIVLNLTLIQFMGVYGIVIGTLLSLLFVNQIYGSSIIFQYYFKNGQHIRYLLLHLKYFLITCGVCGITYGLCIILGSGLDNAWLTVLFRGIICSIAAPILYLLVYRKSNVYKTSMTWLMGKVGVLKKFRRLLLGG